MGKFSIGVRVSDCDGDEGVIVDKRKGERRVKYDRPLPNLWWPKSSLEVIEAMPVASGFKVGDRVKFVGRVGPIGLVGEIVHDDGDDVMPFEVSFDNWRDGHDGTANDDSDNRWNCNGDELELVIDAPLTLRAGGYYKLRNGEVIGPLIDSGNLLFRFTTNPRASFADSWADDGSYFGDGSDPWPRDIVAEVPAPVAVAQPALKIEAGKFYRTRDGRRVGPMKVFRGQGLSRADTKNQDAAFWIDGVGSYTTDGVWLTSSGSEPVDIVAEWIDEPAAASAKPEPKFKPGDKVVSSGNDWTKYTVVECHDGGIDVQANGTDIVYNDQLLALFSLAPEPHPLPVGTKVTLTGTVSGHITTGNNDNVNVVIDGMAGCRRSIGLPISALTAA